MPEVEDRRSGARQPIDSPAVIFWESGDRYCELKVQALDLGAGGMRVRAGAGLKPGAILFCAIPSYGIYSRARVAHIRGFLRRTAGLQFLAGSIPEL
jgi:hypothetical protein